MVLLMVSSRRDPNEGGVGEDDDDVAMTRSGPNLVREWAVGIVELNIGVVEIDEKRENL